MSVLGWLLLVLIVLQALQLGALGRLSRILAGILEHLEYEVSHQLNDIGQRLGPTAREERAHLDHLHHGVEVESCRMCQRRIRSGEKFTRRTLYPLQQASERREEEARRHEKREGEMQE